MFSILLISTASWWQHAHMIITEIATKSLSSSQIEKLQYIINMNGLPYQTLVQSSSWQDDLKDIFKLSIMGNWHFSDMPIIKGDKSKYKIPNPTYNVTTFLLDCWNTLNDPTTTDFWSWSFNLRSLIHFVGDIHTPHHNAQLFSPEFPSGDRGGNSYKFNCPFGSPCNSAHFFWDAVALDMQLADPTASRYIAEFRANASMIQDKFRASQVALQFRPQEWSAQSFEVAKRDGYSVPHYGNPPQDYYKTVRDDCGERIAAAGYRLGEALRTVAAKAPNVATRSVALKVGFWTADAVLMLAIAGMAAYFYITQVKTGFDRLGGPML